MKSIRPLLQTIKIEYCKISIICIFFAILCCSCKNEIHNQINNSILFIQSGSVCGRGSGTDSLKITKSEILYSYYIPRLSDKPQILKKRGISKEEWNQIINCFNPIEFSKLNFNSCNVCFDGCDEWILILNELNLHKITFAKGMKIDNLSQLQLKLSALRAEFNP